MTPQKKKKVLTATVWENHFFETFFQMKKFLVALID